MHEDLGGEYQKGGYRWLRKFWHKKSRSRLGWIYRLVENLFPLSSIIAETVRFDQEAGQLGYCFAAGRFLARLKIKIIFSDSGLLARLKNQPILIFGSHPSGLDPVIVASLVKRRDFYYLGDIYQAMKGPGLAEAVIAVDYRLEDQSFRRRSFWDRTVGWRIMRSLTGYRQGKSVLPEWSNTAARHLRQAGCVLIFPGGGDSQIKDWQPGMALLVNRFKKRFSDRSLNLIMVNIKGISFFRLFRHFLFGSKRLLDKEPVKVKMVKLSWRKLDANASWGKQKSYQIDDFAFCYQSAFNI